jgi:hypothetical protein
MIKNNFRTVPATNFTKKEEQQRQIKKTEKARISKRAKQAENFAGKHNCCGRWKTTLIVSEECAICKSS